MTSTSSSPNSNRQINNIFDIRREVKLLNDNVQQYFFGDQFFKIYKYIDVTSSSF